MDDASSNTEPELHLLLARDPGDDWHRWRVAAIVSAVVHVILLIAIVQMSASPAPERFYKTKPIVRITPLYIPTDLTQTAPNKAKLSKELTVEAIKAIAPRPVARRVPPPAPTPVPQIARVEPRPVLVPEPPKIELPIAQTQSDPIAKVIPAAPVPLPPAAQPPKLAMENVSQPPPPARGSAQGKQLSQLLIPNVSIDAAVRDVTSGSAPGARQEVADTGADTGTTSLGLNLPPSAGRPHSNLELRSDPMGTDFRPYMQQVLAAVRRNWFAVYPEAARLGQRGQVVLEFAITKQGLVTKVIFSSESGAKALDQSAVAAISASNPLPPLPVGFKGDRIVLRMTFMYNMQR